MKRLLVGSVLLVVFAVLAVPTASAANVAGVGWWTRSPAATAPEGGIAVSNAPDGPVSVAAVRVDLGETGVSSGTLTLPQAGGAAPAGAQVAVCVVGDGWKAEAGGAMESAPATTCDGTSAALVADGETWTASVTDLIGESKGTVAFAVVPTTGSSGIWELQFDKPAFQGTAKSGSSSGSRPASQPFAQSTATTTAPRPAQSFSPPPAPRLPAPTTTFAITPTTIDNFVANVAPDSEVAFGGATRDTNGGSSQGRPVGQAITLTIVAAAIGLAGGVAHKVVTARATA